jgi:hypothetical protein
MAAMQGPSVLFCMPNKTQVCLLLVYRWLRLQGGVAAARQAITEPHDLEEESHELVARLRRGSEASFTTSFSDDSSVNFSYGSGARRRSLLPPAM